MATDATTEPLHTVLHGIRQVLHREWRRPPVLQRRWQRVQEDETRTLRVLSFNVLAESKQSEEKWSADAMEALKDWLPRRLRLLEVILQEAPDLVFLQELDVVGKASALCPELKEAGYLAVLPEARAAVPAVFLHAQRFAVLREVAMDFAQVEVLQDVQTAEKLAVASGHLKSGKDEDAEVERSRQVSQLLDCLQQLEVPHVIFAGDLNAVPVVDNKIGKPLAYSAVLHHGLQLSSAYADESGQEPAFTTWKLRPKGEIKRSIDYIFHSPGLVPCSILTLPTDEEMPPERLPCLSYPSDHLALAVDFRYKA